MMTRKREWLSIYKEFDMLAKSASSNPIWKWSKQINFVMNKLILNFQNSLKSSGSVIY